MNSTCNNIETENKLLHQTYYIKQILE